LGKIDIKYLDLNVSLDNFIATFVTKTSESGDFGKEERKMRCILTRGTILIKYPIPNVPPLSIYTICKLDYINLCNIFFWAKNKNWQGLF